MLSIMNSKKIIEQLEVVMIIYRFLLLKVTVAILDK